MKTKNAGITIIVAMATSLLVLGLAFATINSVAQSLEQAGNTQRSTQLFFAAESGIEAAFFHHNSRGQGTTLQTVANQTLEHDSVNVETAWEIIGRANETSSGGSQFYADILRENQTIQIPLAWDTSTTPTGAPNQSGALGTTEDVTIKFYAQLQDPSGTSNDTPDDANIRDSLLGRYNPFVIDNGSGGFDFGDAGSDEVLIDWSLSRKSNQGIETFIPTGNEDCTNGSTVVDGFICENQLLLVANSSLDITTSDTIVGKILPGLTDTNLTTFWNCNEAGVSSCEDFRLTFRPLLKFTDTNTSKIIGIPFSVETNNGSQFPLPDYTVVTDVTQESFSQGVELQIPERTSIGAFDYVIFD